MDRVHRRVAVTPQVPDEDHPSATTERHGRAHAEGRADTDEAVGRGACAGAPEAIGSGAMGAMFRERVEAMMDALRAHPRVQTDGIEFRRPATTAEIAATERGLRRPLPDDVREFYLAHDGAFLSWGLAGREYRRLERFWRADYGVPPGGLNVMPLFRAFSNAWMNDATVNWTADDHRELYGAELDSPKRVRAVVVDYYSRYRHADMVFGPKGSPARVLVATDHGADPGESDASSFTTYLETALALWFTDRFSVYERAAGAGPRVLTEAPPQRTLDEVIEALEEEAAREDARG